MGKINDDLSPMTIGANGVKVYENLNFAMLAGLESQLMLKWKNFDFLNLIKYTYGKTDHNQPLPLIPALKNNIELNYHLNSSWHFTISVESATAQNRTNNEFGESNTPGYTIANCVINKSFQLKETQFRANIGVENIFDKNYYEHLDWGNISRTGRNFSLGVYVNF